MWIKTPDAGTGDASPPTRQATQSRTRKRHLWRIICHAHRHPWRIIRHSALTRDAATRNIFLSTTRVLVAGIDNTLRSVLVAMRHTTRCIWFNQIDRHGCYIVCSALAFGLTKSSRHLV